MVDNMALEGGRSDLEPWLHHFYLGITLSNCLPLCLSFSMWSMGAMKVSTSQVAGRV